MRPDPKDYFMKIAIDTGARCTCFSESKGAVITVENHIVATGYNGAPHGIPNCKYDTGVCRKRSLGYKSGEGQHECVAMHAEANAIVISAKLGVRIQGGTMYCTHQPCAGCAKLIINAGIAEVIYMSEYPDNLGLMLLMQAGVKVSRLNLENT